MRKQNGIYLFNIIPRYRPGMSDVFDSVKLATLPSGAQRIKQNSFFGTLENICGECLDEVDLLYVFATDGDRNYAKINWRSPGSFTPTEVNELTFTENIGFNGNGTNSYLNTNFIPNTNAVNYTLNNACLFCYINNDISSNTKFDFGVVSAPGDIRFISRNASNTHSFLINTINNSTVGSSVSGAGFYQIQRTGSAVSKLFKNGSQVGADITTSSVGLPSRFLPLLANNNLGTAGSFSDRQMGMFGLGSSLTGQESALYTAWNNYFTSL